MTLVSTEQSTIVKDRQILNGSFILNEVVSRCKVKTKKVIILKVDFAKACDSVR